MYYYQIQDVNGSVVKDCPTAFYSGDEAMEAAKDELITLLGFVNFPVEIRIGDGRFFEGQEQFSSTYYMNDGMVREYWRQKIEEANRKELTDIVLGVLERDEIINDQYNRGLMTPSDFVRAKESMWIGARISIEARGGQHAT